MANIYPTQQRTIDPYAEYNSNATNRLTRVSTLGQNCILIPPHLAVTINSANVVTISRGKCLIDDVLIDITESFPVDFREASFYFSSSPFNEAGIYYLTLYYKYVKAKPAPKAFVRIFKPSERMNWNENYLFLKAVKVEFSGSVMRITNVFDSDPGNSNRKRRYLPKYIDVIDALPSWSSSDIGRLIFHEKENLLYIGGSDGWRLYSPVLDFKDTTNCDVGALGYIDGTKVVHAIANNVGKLASCVILKNGREVDQSGLVMLFGVVDNILVESGVSLTYGNRLYLSASEAGRVTNVPPENPNFAQFIGFAVENATNYAKIWFTPNSEFKDIYELVQGNLFKIKVSYEDSLAEYLSSKIVGSGGISTTIDHDYGSGIEKLILSGDRKLKVTSADISPNYLYNKISAGSGIVLTLLNVGGNELLRISSTGGGGGGSGFGGVPVGSVVAYAGTSAPEGFLLCDGSIYDSTEYGELFNIIGEMYNIGGEEEGKFRVPNLRSRVIVGMDSTNTYFDVIGEYQNTTNSTSGQIPYGILSMNYIIRHTAVGISDTDEKIKVSSSDTYSGYLNEKLEVGDGLIKEVVGTGNQKLRIELEGESSILEFFEILDFEGSVTTESLDVYSLPASTTTARNLFANITQVSGTFYSTSNFLYLGAVEFPFTWDYVPTEDLVVSAMWGAPFKEGPFFQVLNSGIIPYPTTTEMLRNTVNAYTFKNPSLTDIGGGMKRYVATATTWNFFAIESIKPTFEASAGSSFSIQFINTVFEDEIHIPFRENIVPDPEILAGPALRWSAGLAPDHIACECDSVQGNFRSFGEHNDLYRKILPECYKESSYTPVNYHFIPKWVVGVHPAPTVESKISKFNSNFMVLKAGTRYTFKVRSIFSACKPEITTLASWDGKTIPSCQWGGGLDTLLARCLILPSQLPTIWNYYKNAGLSKIRVYTLKKNKIITNL